MEASNWAYRMFQTIKVRGEGDTCLYYVGSYVFVFVRVTERVRLSVGTKMCLAGTAICPWTTVYIRVIRTSSIVCVTLL